MLFSVVVHLMYICSCTLLVKDEDTPFRVPLPEGTFEGYELEPPPNYLEVTKKELKDLYYDMWKIRYGVLGCMILRLTSRIDG